MPNWRKATWSRGISLLRHFMMTSSNGNIFRVTGHLCICTHTQTERGRGIGCFLCILSGLRLLLESCMWCCVISHRVLMTSSNGNIFPRYWPFVRGIHRSPVNSPHKGQWRGALMFSLICARINGWVNNGEAGDLRCHRAHYDVIVMCNTVIRHHANLYFSVTMICIGGPNLCLHGPVSLTWFNFNPSMDK